MRSALITHHALEEAEKQIVSQFEHEAVPLPEVTENYQNAIDGMQGLIKLSIRGTLDWFKERGHNGREWACAEDVFNKLKAFRTKIRELLGAEYLLGNICLHVSTNHTEKPVALSFKIHRAEDKNSRFDIIVHGNTESEDIAISKQPRSALVAQANQNTLTFETFGETLAALEAPMKN